MTKTNPFEEFWKKWDNCVYWTVEGKLEKDKNGVCAFHQSDWEQLKKEFFSLLEQQAKKAEEWKDVSDWEHGKRFGIATALRLVQGGSDSGSLTGRKEPPTKKQPCDSFEQAKREIYEELAKKQKVNK